MKSAWCIVIITALSAGQSMAAATFFPSSVEPKDYGPCGVTAMYCSARLLGLAPQWDQVRRALGAPAPDGTHSFQQLAQAARQLGLQPVAAKVPASQLDGAPMPAIAHMKYSSMGNQQPHFVVLLGCVVKDHVWLLDPPRRPMRVPWQGFQEAYSGHVLFLARTAEQGRQLEAGIPSWWSILAMAVGLFGAAGMVAAAVVLIAARHRLAEWIRRLQSGKSATASLHPRWRLIGILTGLAAAGGSVVVVSPWGLLRTRHTLVLPRESLNLGDIPTGERTLSVPLSNRGSGELVITSVRCSCPGTVTEFPKSIPPSQTRPIKLNLSVQPGHGTADLRVYCVDGETQQTRLRWFGLAPVVPVPHMIAESHIPIGRPYEQVISLLYHASQSDDAWPECKCEATGIKFKLERDHQLRHPRLIGFPFGTDRGPVMEARYLLRALITDLAIRFAFE